MSDPGKTIFVYAQWPDQGAPHMMGHLHAQLTRGKEIFSFEFSPGWLGTRSGQMLDHDLQFFPGRQYADSGKGNFGIFLDSSPDRWGRRLMRRREAIRARREERPVRGLLESDYLLEVHDETRMGALRFKLDESGDFVSHDSDLSVPPWTSLRELETACRHYEKDDPADTEHEKWLAMLLAPGSSLGGARPKANVIDRKGDLWIAKFPSRSDSTNAGAWEMVVHELAKSAGLKVPDCGIGRFSQFGGTFLSRRFDRRSERRIHFASAMTLLGRADGDDGATGCSYLDLAQFIVRNGAAPNEDLDELWRRVLFNVAVSNTDDHLRNHGFLLTPRGWTLSPAYDMNPVPHGGGLSLNISEDDNSTDFELVLSVAPLFRVNPSRARESVTTTEQSVRRWREVAMKFNISRAEIESMAPAFRFG